MNSKLKPIHGIKYLISMILVFTVSIITFQTNNIAFAAEAIPPVCSQLVRTDALQDRYLSLPNSRIVINPFNFEGNGTNVTQSQYSNSPTIPLNIGYNSPLVSNKRGPELRGLIKLYERKSNSSTEATTKYSANGAKIISDFTTSFTDPKYATLTLQNSNAVIKIATGADPIWQHIEYNLGTPLNFNNKILMNLKLKSANGNWALKISENTNSPDVDYTLFESNQSGDFTFDLSDFVKDKASFLNSKSRLKIKLFGIGVDSSTEILNLSIVEINGSSLLEASNYTTSWRPDKLLSTATYKDGNSLKVKDFLHDDKTVIRQIDTTDTEMITVIGKLERNSTFIDNSIVSYSDVYGYGISFKEDISQYISFYSTYIDALSSINSSKTPSNASTCWKVDFPAKQQSIKFSIVVDSNAISNAEYIKLSTSAINSDIQSSMTNRENYWNNILKKIPLPYNFDLYTTTLDVTNNHIKQMYYSAWYETITNLLPENTEINYNYKSFAAGKAALWGYGEEKSPYQASWDSLYAMQLYAYIEPNDSWNAFLGLMSQVNSSGMLGGESLPSVKAKTAWILYAISPQITKLKQVEPQIEQYLDWRINNPRWIYMNYTPDINLKDLDFVASALVDILYYQKICKQLGLSDKIAEWQIKYDKLFSQCEDWFFPKNSFPVQYYSGGTLSQGNDSWVTKALMVPGLKSSQISSLASLFHKNYNKAANFSGQKVIKFEDYIYTYHGLMQNGYFEEARNCINSSIRDITKIGWLSEGYNYADVKSLNPEGVSPSQFGASQLIYGVLALNGVRIDDGYPVINTLFNRSGGVGNLNYDNVIYSIYQNNTSFTINTNKLGTITQNIPANNTVALFKDKMAYPFKSYLIENYVTATGLGNVENSFIVAPLTPTDAINRSSDSISDGNASLDYVSNQNPLSIAPSESEMISSETGKTPENGKSNIVIIIVCSIIILLSVLSVSLYYLFTRRK